MNDLVTYDYGDGMETWVLVFNRFMTRDNGADITD